VPDVEGSFRPRLPGYGPFLPNGAVVVPLSEAMWVDPGTLVPTADQNGSEGAPFDAIQTAVDALAAKVQGTVVLAPGVYPAEVINVGATKLTLFGLGSLIQGADCGACSINAVAPLALVNVSEIGAVASTSDVYFQGTQSTSAISAQILTLIDSSCGTFTVAASLLADNSSCVDGGTTGGINAHDSEFFTVTNPYVVGSGAELFGCDFFADCLANAITFRDCNIAGAFTGSDFRAFNTHFGGGSVNVTVQIVVDAFTYSRLAPALWVATNGVFIQDAPWSPCLHQIGWTAAVVSTLQTVLVANFHAPGIYAVYAPLVVRTAAGAGTATRTISWSTPTLGAQTHVTAGIVLTTLGTKAQDVVLVVSDGLADVTVQYTPVGIAGAPVIDVYTASLQGGANLF